jgi:hypothetical protein
MIAALFVERDGAYYGLPDVDPWDVERDARRYAGPYPVVAHPPCDRWNLLSAVNNARWGYGINAEADEGRFEAALAAVRRWGGVLEHPAETRAFKHYRIPEPARGHWQRTLDGDWVTEVNQSAYGHRARKRTWLLYCGAASPPSLNWRDVPGTHRVGFGFPADTDKPLPNIKQDEALATPPAFRDLLLNIARAATPQERAA